MSKIEPLDEVKYDNRPLREIQKLNEVIIKLNNQEDILSGLVEEVSTDDKKYSWETGKKCHRGTLNCPVHQGALDIPGDRVWSFPGSCGVEDTNKDSELTTTWHDGYVYIDSPYLKEVEQAVKLDRERIIKALDEAAWLPKGATRAKIINYSEAIEIVRGQE